MGRFSTIQNAFSLGEVSPKMLGRSDLKDEYNKMCFQLQNFITLKQGGATRRPGGQYQFSSINGVPLPQNGKVRILPFVVSKTQTFQIILFPNDIGINSIGLAVFDPVTGLMHSTFGFRSNVNDHALYDIIDYRATRTLTTQAVLYKTFTGLTSNNTVQDFLNIDFAQSGDVMVVVGTEQCPLYLAFAPKSTGNETFGNNYSSGGLFKVYDLWTSKNIIPLTQQTNFSLSTVNQGAVGTPAIGAGYYPPNPVNPWECTPWTFNNLVPTATVQVTGGGYATPGTSGVAFTATNFQFNLGDLIRIDSTSTTGIGIVDNISTPSMTVLRAFGDQTADIAQISMWSFYGWPKTVCFFQQRVVFGGSDQFIDTFWGSEQGNITILAIQRTLDDTNFSNVSNDRPFQFSLAQNELNEIRWLSADRDLMIGTSGGEWLAGGSDTTQSLGPLNIGVQLQTNFGSEKVKALRSDAACQFVQRGGQKVREIVYDFRENYRLANDITNYAEHIVRVGVNARTNFSIPSLVQSAYQANDNNISWFLDSNYNLIGCTRDRATGTLAWHRHPMGGTCNGGISQSFTFNCVNQGSMTAGEYFVFYDGGNNKHYVWAKINGVGSDPGIGGTPHILIVNTADSAAVIAATLTTLINSISGFAAGTPFDPNHNNSGAFGINSSITIVNTLDGTVTQPSIGTSSGSIIVTQIGLTGSVTEVPRVFSICSMPSLNGQSDDVWMVVNRQINGVSTTFVEKMGKPYRFDAVVNSSTLIEDKLVLADCSGLQRLGSPGNTFNAFTWLKNTLVDIIADGNYIGGITVDSTGTITLPGPTTYTEVIAGIPFSAYLKPMPIVAGAITGSADGVWKRADRLILRFWNTIACEYGKTDDASLINIAFRNQSVLNGTPTPMFTGVQVLSYQDDVENDVDVIIKSNVSMPCTLTALSFRGVTYEG